MNNLKTKNFILEDDSTVTHSNPSKNKRKEKDIFEEVQENNSKEVQKDIHFGIHEEVQTGILEFFRRTIKNP